MLFNSTFFIFVFLPTAVVGFFLFTKASTQAGIIWLVVASLVFYGWSDSRFLALLVPSVVFNYYAGLLITRSADSTARSITIAAVAANLACLGYFKYIGFAVANINWLVGSHIQVAASTLPLGISFFTFTQIAFLVDTYR